MSQAKIQAALETAVDGMVGLIPAVAVVSSIQGAATVFTTSTPHGLSNGVSATLSSHSVVNGQYSVEVVDATKFKMRSLSSGAYVSTASTGSGGQIKADLTEWENTSFSPIVDVPWQRVSVMFAEPDAPSMGSSMRREVGFLQITLFYPKQIGTADINDRIEMIMSLFKRGATFVKDSVKVVVNKPPMRIKLGEQGQSYAVAVRIPFYSDIYS